MKEKHNSLLIQKDLMENDMKNLKNSFDNEKNLNLKLFNRVNELEGKINIHYLNILTLSVLI